MIESRVSVVPWFKILGVSIASVVLVGDSVKIKPKSKALAVHRQIALFDAYEGSFDYPAFKKEIGEVEKELPEEPFEMTTVQETGTINVRDVYIYALSSSAIYQVGSTRKIDAESRVMHIRQFVTNPESAVIDKNLINLENGPATNPPKKKA